MDTAGTVIHCGQTHDDQDIAAVLFSSGRSRGMGLPWLGGKASVLRRGADENLSPTDGIDYTHV